MRDRRTGLKLLLTVCIVALLGSTGCSSATSSAASAPAAPATQHSVTPNAAAPPDAAGVAHGAATVPASPQDAALQLEALLGQHAVLAADMMRGRIRNDEDFGQAASAAIGRNTDDLAQLVGALFGAAAADQFRNLWADHVTALFNYSSGLATDDAGTRDQARAALVRFENDLAEFFSSASQGRLNPQAARSAVLTHVDHLLEQADAYAMGDYARSNELYRAGLHAHLRAGARAGHHPAAARPGGRAGRAAVAAALRAGPAARRARGAGRRRAAGRCDRRPRLRRGRGRAQRQHQRPDRRGRQPVRRTGRNRVHDAVGRPHRPAWWPTPPASPPRTRAGGTRRRPRCAASSGGWADFLAAAAGNRLGSPALAQALLAHDDMLLRQVDAFVAKDYPQANDLSYRAYQDMFGLARQLSDAFGASRGGPVARRAGRRPAPAGRPRGRDDPNLPPLDAAARRSSRRTVLLAAVGAPAATVAGPVAAADARSADAAGRGGLPVGAQLSGGAAAGAAADTRGGGGHPAATAGPGPGLARSRYRRTSPWPAGSPTGPRPGQAGPAVHARPCRLGQRARRVPPVARARTGCRGAGGPGRRQLDRLPGDRRAARAEGGFSHRAGVWTDAGAIPSPGDLRWLVRPRPQELPRQRDRLCRADRVVAGPGAQRCWSWRRPAAALDHRRAHRDRRTGVPSSAVQPMARSG